jgi:hypothetical protein
MTLLDRNTKAKTERQIGDSKLKCLYTAKEIVKSGENLQNRSHIGQPFL